MPPKKSSQVYIVAVRNDAGLIIDLIDAYTTAELAESAIGESSNSDGLEVITLDLKSAAAAAPKKATKTVASRAKPAKKTKEDEAEVEDDHDEDEQAEAMTKRGGEKRKQMAEGKEGSLNGLKLLFTGTFAMDRKTCEATAIKHGATIVTTMKQADYVVLGTKAGPKKLDEINDKGYKTMDEEEFHAKLEGEGGNDETGSKKKRSA